MKFLVMTMALSFAAVPALAQPTQGWKTSPALVDMSATCHRIYDEQASARAFKKVADKSEILALLADDSALVAQRNKAAKMCRKVFPTG